MSSRLQRIFHKYEKFINDKVIKFIIYELINSVCQILKFTYLKQKLY